jgi:hypothetical protein
MYNNLENRKKKSGFIPVLSHHFRTNLNSLKIIDNNLKNTIPESQK